MQIKAKHTLIPRTSKGLQCVQGTWVADGTHHTPPHSFGKSIVSERELRKR
jgi:hypothetical protein